MLESEADGRGAYDVLDADGFLWYFHAPVALEYSLFAGTEHSLDELSNAAVAESLFAARLTLKSLTRQARRPSGEYARRLREKGHGAEDASLALLIAELRGEIDEYAYASYLTELRYERRREGAAALRRWLLARGFARSIVDKVIAAHSAERDPLAEALLLLEKHFKPEDKRERAWAFLARRGYDAELAGRALRRFFAGDGPWE